MFICPNCQSRLSKVSGEAGIFWSCPSCNGRAVTVPVLKNVLPQTILHELWQHARAADSGGRACPSCEHAMNPVLLPAAGTALYVDVCIGCSFVWFDPEEFESVAGQDTLSSTQESVISKQVLAKAEVQIVHEGLNEVSQYIGPPDQWWHVFLAVFGLPVEYDNQGIAGKPVITWGLSALMLLVYLVTAAYLQEIVQDWGLVPAELYRHFGATFITSFLLHGGILHLIGNLYFFLVFGDNVEQDLGGMKFLALLAAASLLGDAFHILADPGSGDPVIGASGGISGVLVYYALRFRKNRVGMLIFFRWYRIPVRWMLALWIAAQVFGAVNQIAGHSQVSALAHLGGSAVGYLFWLYEKQSYSIKQTDGMPELRGSS